MRTALIDADSIIHIVSYHNAVDTEFFEVSEPEDKEALIQSLYEGKDPTPVLATVDSFINDILNAVNATHYLGFVGHRDGLETFRHKLAVTKPYKGNRGKSPHWTKYWKPIIIEHMVKQWYFIELENIEADDACSIYAREIPNSIVCSPDKDLKQIPGDHYDYKKIEFDHVTQHQALVNLYTQCLVGDGVDNISGCKGVGKKSPLLPPISDIETEGEMYNYVKDIFSSKHPNDDGHTFIEQLSLVKMLQETDEELIKPYPKPVLGDIVDDFKQDTIPETPPLPTFSQ